jgi:exodeoxyribonuclease VII small subunit
MNPPIEKPSYEQALAELDQIVRALEDGQTSLDSALAQYEKGVGLVKHCYQQLHDAEQRIRLLSGEDEQGNPILQPFSHTSSLPSHQSNATSAPNNAGG